MTDQIKTARINFLNAMAPNFKTLADFKSHVMKEHAEGRLNDAELGLLFQSHHIAGE